MGSVRAALRAAPAPQRRAQQAAAPAPQRANAGAARSLQQRIGRQGMQALAARAPAVQRRIDNAGAGATARGGARVSSPADPAEREAEATARQVMRAAAAPEVAPAGPGIARKGGEPPPLTPAISAGIAASAGAGVPLPQPVRKFMEPRFKADFGQVRIHTGLRAAQLSAQLNAQAFTVGHDIFFGKDRFKPDTPDGLELIAHELTHTIQQGAAVQRRAAPEVRALVGRHVQRDLLPSPIDYAVEHANLIPGFRMLTIVLGFNPINMSRVERSAANILRALIELLPGGKLLTDALNNSGVFDKVGAWVGKKLQGLGMAAASIKKGIDDFIASVGLTDLAHPGAVWERAKHVVTDPIDRIVRFGKGLVDDMVQFVKDAILRPLAGLAEKLPSWKLLTAVLGKDPITGDPVPRTADSIIGPFMKLIGQEEVWENMKKAKAVARAWAWMQGAMAGLMGFVRQIPVRALGAFKSLALADIVLLPRAFAKVAAAFGDFVGEFIGWAGKAVWTLLEIVFDSVSPGAFGYIKRTGAALKSILKNPLPFVGNLVKAAKLGFLNFADRFGAHLKTGLMDWLTGALPGVYVPKAFALGEIVKFAFSVLGISWQNIRQKLVKAVGDPAVKAMEAGFDIVVTLVREGPAAAWDKIKEQLAGLKDQVIGGITDFVVDMVVKKAVPKLVAMFIPGAGFISAIMSVYDTIMVFVKRIATIIEVVKGFIDSIVAIAGGAIGAAAGKVESTLAGLVSLAINFLAGFIGLGKVADRVMGVIGKVRATIDKGLDAMVRWIVTMAKKLGKLVVQAGVPQDPKERLKLGVAAALKLVNRFKGKRVGKVVIAPLLMAVKVRYGFTALDVEPVGGIWWVHAKINPEEKAPTEQVKVGGDKDSGSDKAEAESAAWPVKPGDNIRVKGSNRIEQVLEVETRYIKYTLRHRQGGHFRIQPRESFLADWKERATFRAKGDSVVDEREFLLEKFPGQVRVVDAIMNRGELRKQLLSLDPVHAHHIIPIGILEFAWPIRKLIQEYPGWDFNSAINGVALQAGFHGSHPSYSAYVLKLVVAWAKRNESAPLGAIKLHVETELLPHLRKEIDAAQSKPEKKGDTLNDYFKRLL